MSLKLILSGLIEVNDSTFNALYCLELQTCNSNSSLNASHLPVMRSKTTWINLPERQSPKLFHWLEACYRRLVLRIGSLNMESLMGRQVTGGRLGSWFQTHHVVTLAEVSIGCLVLQTHQAVMRVLSGSECEPPAHTVGGRQRLHGSLWVFIPEKPLRRTSCQFGPSAVRIHAGVC